MKILVILPRAIAGCLIMQGLADALCDEGCEIKSIYVDKIQPCDLDFKPFIILGYNYSFLTNEATKLIIDEYIADNKTKLVCYFCDEPRSIYGQGSNKSIYENLKKYNPLVFIWDKHFISDFNNSHYLPLAVNPSKYDVDFKGFKYDISFVGRPLSNHRQELLCEIIKNFGDKLSIFAYQPHFNKSVEEIKEKELLNKEQLEVYKKSYKGFVQYREKELAEIYIASKINLNIDLQGVDSLNYRTFEVLASKGFLLTNERKDLYELIPENPMLRTYKTKPDLIEKINQRLDDKCVYESFNSYIEDNTYKNRAIQILDKIFRDGDFNGKKRGNGSNSRQRLFCKN